MLESIAKRTFISILFSLALTSCGFKLAGSAPIPDRIKSIQLQTSNFSHELRSSLIRQLQQAGAEVVSEQNQSSVKLNVSLLVESDRRLVSSGSTGKTVDRLTRYLRYHLQFPSGESVHAATKLIEVRDIELDSDNLQASANEKNSIVRDMEDTLVYRMIEQLKRLNQAE